MVSLLLAALYTSAAVRRPHLIVGALLAALGAFSIFEAGRLRDDWQGARLMPAVVGVLLVVLGAAHLVLRAPAPTDPPDTRARWRVLLIFALLVVYVVAMPAFGFLPATAVFFLVLLAWLGEFSWPVTLGMTVALSAASHLLFKHWLGMPLPSGPFGL
jgi:putative tricarboxylic transport membrane protein